MVKPLKKGMLTDACPMQDVLDQLAGSLKELQAFKNIA